MSISVKSVFVALFLIFNLNLAHAQNQIADSLYRILNNKNTPDTTRIETLIQLSSFYSEVNADTAMLFANQAKKIVDQKQVTRLLPRVLRYMAINMVVKGEYKSASAYLHHAISQCNADSSQFLKKEKALAYNLLGVILVYQSKYDSALLYYFDALAILKKLGDSLGISNRYNNIANVYKNLGNYPLALKYYFEARKLGLTPRGAQNIGLVYFAMNESVKAKKYLLLSLALYKQQNEFDNTGVAIVSEMLGNLYSSAGKADSALYNLSRALQINERAKHKNGIAQTHYYFGLHYKNNRQWSQAVQEANTAMEMHRQGGEKLELANAILLVAESHFNLQHETAALTYANEGLLLAKEIKAKQPQLGCLELLASIYASQKNFVQAYAFSQLLSEMKDSLNNEEKIKQVANMEALYENDKKEKELVVVRAEKLTADAQLNEQKTRTTLLIVGLGLVTLMLVTGLFSYLTLRRSRKLLETKNEELRKLNQTKDRFFAIVGHDLRGPITSFSGINDLLNWHIAKNDMDKVKAMGNKITQSVRQLDTLLNNLLNWAMSQTDAVPYRPEPLQLNQLTKECYGFFEHALELKRINLVDQTKDDFLVYADKNALATVIRNLISNAVKFTPTAGKITISSRLIDNFVWIDIRDTGVGLPPDKLLTIFALSENKTTSGTSGEKGTGLGLVLCSDYVALNKGAIEVQSEVGEGSVFSFSVPSFQPKELQNLKKEMSHG
jgi:two-component system, NtrC family, sensor kinase